jgi:hypothetical protein
MIGDARARGKSKGPVVFKKKNSKGRSFKTIDAHKDLADDDGDADTHPVARRMTKGQKPGPGRDRQNPKEQRARKIEAWCRGKGDCPL